MTKLGFPEVWIKRVICYVSTPLFSVRINGKFYGNITPSRGLRHPLSLYLFLLCAEGFSSLLAKAEAKNRLHGVSICRRAPRISHLLFVDNSLLFCRATQKEVQAIVDILQLYATASGQLINFEKSSIYFSSNTDGGQRNWIKTRLNVKEVDRFETYLGLLTLIGRSKYQSFVVLKDKVWKNLQRWKGIMLSRVGKEVLIKAVAQSLLTYTMGVFQLPMKLCDELNAMCARFWWGQVGNERKIHWKSWESLSKPKKEGGMGFRDIRCFNMVMLAKQGWRLLKEKDTLFYRCFKVKYFPWCNFLEAGDVPNSSYVWKSIMVAQLILKKGSCWRVGDGSRIRVLKDKWIPNHPTNRVLHPPGDEEREWRVSELIDWSLKVWDRDLIERRFHHEDADAILRIPLSRQQTNDTLFWLHSTEGEFSVKTGHHLARVLKWENDVNEGCSSSMGCNTVWARSGICTY